MSIRYLHKDITTVEHGIIAHGCNASHGFGSGVAGAIRKKWPIVYTEFMKDPMGPQMLGLISMVYIADDLFVANCYTQHGYGHDGKKYASVDAVEKCLTECVFFAKTLALPLYMPKIGCGLGGLGWSHEVEPIVNKLAQQIEINICEI